MYWPRRFLGGSMASRWVALAVVVLLALAACSPASGSRQSSGGPTASGVGVVDEEDPAPPKRFSVVEEVGQQGGRVTGEHAGVVVPEGTWRKGTTGTVSVSNPLTATDGRATSLVWGAPIGVEHDGDLRRALTLTWDVSALSDEQRQSLVLTRWDPRQRAWAYQDVPFTVSSGTLNAEVREFSLWTWAASVDQTVGQVLGKRAAAPKCSSIPLPSWVTSVVRPDQDIAAAAVRTCAEGNGNSEQVVVRVVNNRSFAQRLSLGPDGSRWASARQREEEISVTGAVWIAAHAVMASNHTYLIPPTSEVMITLARPSSPEPVQLQFSAQADATTVFADLVSYGVETMKLPDLGSPVAAAYLQAYLKCGGAKLSQSPPTDAQAAVATALDTVHQCSSTMFDDPDGPLAATLQDEVEAVHRREVAKGGRASARAVRNFRAMHQVTDRLGYLKLFEFADYTSNQAADAFGVGPTGFTVTVTGRPPVLGSWRAGCADADADSDLLYRNLGRQDTFVSANVELWRLPAWKQDGQKALKPLARCSAGHRADVARNITATWGVDTKSAQVIANLLAPSTGKASLRADDILNAPVPASCRHEAGRLVNGDLPLPIDPDLGYSQEGDASVKGGLPPLLVDLDGDGVDELVGVLGCTAGGVSWPNIILVYTPGPTLAGFVNLGDLYAFEHSEVLSMTPTADGLRIVWVGYEGCCGDKSLYTGYLRKVGFLFPQQGEYYIINVTEGTSQ